MPVSKRWIDFKEENLKEILNTYGVYQLADADKEIIYIGEGKLRHNLLVQFNDKSEKTASTAYFRYRENDSKKSSKQRKNILIKEFIDKHGKPPKFN